MNKSFNPILLLCLVITLSACSLPGPASLPTAIVQPSVTSLPPTDTPFPPTDTLVPTDTSIPTPILTETPVGQIFRDDFTGALQPGWTWKNENSSRWTITTDGWLQITGEDPSLFGDGIQSNLLWRDPPTGEYQVTVHVNAATTTNFQQATLYLYQDGDNFVAINRGFCSFCVAGGNGIYMEYKYAGAWGTFRQATLSNDVYLRLVTRGDVIEGFYALQPDQWKSMGKVGNYLKNFEIGLGVSNVDSNNINSDLIGRFDYIEIALP